MNAVITTKTILAVFLLFPFLACKKTGEPPPKSPLEKL